VRATRLATFNANFTGRSLERLLDEGALLLALTCLVQRRKS
jgi:hypothetical protein